VSFYFVKYFSISIYNPYNKIYKEYYYRDKQIPNTNKAILIQIYKNNNLLSLDFNWTLSQSHAGIFLELGILGYNILLNLYDKRHWDYENNRWEEHNAD